MLIHHWDFTGRVYPVQGCNERLMCPLKNSAAVYGWDKKIWEHRSAGKESLNKQQEALDTGISQEALDQRD